MIRDAFARVIPALRQNPKGGNTILIRRTLDWRSARHEDLWDDKIRAAAYFWDGLFDISYIESRARIKEIAQAAKVRIPGASIINYQENKPSFAKGDMVLIGDDDDWYHPEIFQYLKQAEGQHSAGFVWHDSLYGYHISKKQNETFVPCLTKPFVRRIDNTDLVNVFKTNNYAISGDYLTRHPLSAVLEHFDADKEFRTLEDGKVVALPHLLSMVNRHPCSYMVLTRQLESDPSPEGLLALVDAYAHTNVETAEPEVAWALPLIAESKQLFAEVLASRKPAMSGAS